MLPEECDVKWNGEKVEQHDQHQCEIPVSSKVAQRVDDVTWTYGKKWLKLHTKMWSFGTYHIYVRTKGADPTSDLNLFIFSRIKGFCKSIRHIMMSSKTDGFSRYPKYLNLDIYVRHF